MYTHKIAMELVWNNMEQIGYIDKCCENMFGREKKIYKIFKNRLKNKAGFFV